MIIRTKSILCTFLQPDVEAVALKNGRIIFTGSTVEVKKFISASTQVIDVKGGTVIPGLVDSHTHVAGLGAKLERVDLTNAKNEQEAVALVAARTKDVPAGDWIIGQDWDEGAWASSYPDKKLLTEKVPNHPVLMQNLHGFAAWGNQMALDRAGWFVEREGFSNGRCREGGLSKCGCEMKKCRFFKKFRRCDKLDIRRQAKRWFTQVYQCLKWATHSTKMDLPVTKTCHKIAVEIIVTFFLFLFVNNFVFAQQQEVRRNYISLQPAIGWYAPSFSFYNNQYKSLDDVPFTNDVANSFRLPEIGGGRELAFEVRWKRNSPGFGFGIAASTLDTGIRAPLSDPPKPGDNRTQTYEHRLELTPIFLSAFLYLPLSNLAEIYFGQGIGLVKVAESVKIFGEDDLAIFEDRNESTGLLFQPAIGVQHTFAEQSFVFAELQYILGGYSAQGWSVPLDPFKSIFLRRGSVSLAGLRVRMGLGFNVQL
jgi:opacity protein-like surface antigen